MKNSSNLFTFILFLILSACTSNHDFNPILSNNNFVENTINLTSPNRHYYYLNKAKCYPVAHDCFPDIIVTAPKSIFINELDSLILADDVQQFFEDNGNYQELFPGLYGQSLFDLRNCVVTLRKGFTDDTTIFYHIILRSDTNVAADYSQYY